MWDSAGSLCPIILGIKSESPFSCVQLFATPWSVARQTSLSMEFSRPEYWSGSPFPSLGDLPNPGIEPRSPILQQTLYHLSHQEAQTNNSPIEMKQDPVQPSQV